MTRYSSGAEYATIVEGKDLYEISNGCLKFKHNKSGTIIAKFMVTESDIWKKIRLTYRLLSKESQSENIIMALLKRVNRFTLESEILYGASSQNNVSDDVNIRSTNSASGSGAALTEKSPNTHFYEIEVVMNRSSLLVPPNTPELENALEFIFNAGNIDPDKPNQTSSPYDKSSNTRTEETPSVPIPPPSPSETANVKSHLQSSILIPRGVGVLTPGPEFILAELSTASTGF